MKKRDLFFWGFLVLTLLSFSGVSLQAQTYPDHPIQLVIPMTPGDMTDLTGRALASELTKLLKTSVIPINKAGAGASMGADFVAKARKDGYTILYANSNIYYAHAMDPENVSCNPLQDLDALCLAVSLPIIVVVQGESPWKTMQEFVDHMKQNPGKVRVSTTGVGGVGHFNHEVIRLETKTDSTMIPYKGASPALTALLGGHIEAAFVAYAMVYPHYESGKLRGILADQKVAALPDIPTLTQLGYKQDLPPTYFGFAAPAGIPEEARKVLVPAIEKASRNPELAEKLKKIWFIPDYKSPAEFKQLVTRDYENACAIVKKMEVSK